MKIYSFLSLAVTVLVNPVFAVNAQSVQAESKLAQCQRFEAGLTRYHQRLTAPENDRNSQLEIAANLVEVLKPEIEYLKNQQFSDPTIQAIHQRALNSIVTGHKNMAAFVSASQQGEEAKANEAYNNLQLTPYQLMEAVQPFEQYCGKLNSGR